MPKLLVFVACENVLISKGEAASLIVLLHQLTLAGDIPDPVPPNSASPLKWYIFSQWETTQDEVGVRFEQKFEMWSSDNIQRGIQGTTEFVPDGKPLHRVIASFTLFPLVPDGQYRLRLSIRRVGEDLWTLVGDYPLQVMYQRSPAPVPLQPTEL